MTNLAVEPVPYSPDHLKTYVDIVPPEMCTPKAISLIRKEKEAPIDVGRDKSLRLKVIDRCGHACVFCHNEGTLVSGAQSRQRVSVFLPLQKGKATFKGFEVDPIDPHDPAFHQEIDKARDTFGIDEVHLTGGEPTQHPQLPDIVRVLSGKGITVKMTSNGESGGDPYEALAKAGLKSVSISIFGSTPQEYAATQPTKFSVAWAANKLLLSQEAITKAKGNGIEVKSNCVMSGATDAERIHRLIQRAREEGFNLRILNDLSGGAGSIAAIYNLLAELGASPTRRKLTAGVSGVVSYFQLPDGQPIGFKQIRKVRLPAACRACDLDAGGKCEEGYYGLRLYRKKDNGHIMGVCIQRMDLALPTDDFYKGAYPASINRLREEDYQELLRMSSGVMATRDRHL